jgi:flagellar L-ring protein precursor FlgH
MVLFLWIFVVQLPAQNFDNYKMNSLYTDFRANAVGDIITILIMESTAGSGQSDNKSADQSNLNGQGNITGNLTSVLPLIGASSSFSSNNSAQSTTAQKDVLSGKLTVMVTQILPNGNLALSGKRQLEVSGESYILEVRGIARPKDISSENTIYSFNLANVEIAYKKSGLLNKMGKPGLMARWTTWLMMAGLGTAAYLGISAASGQ